MIQNVWKSSSLIVLSILMLCIPAFACTAIPSPEPDRVETVFWDDADLTPTDQQFQGEFIEKIIFVERSNLQILFSSDKNKLKAKVLESPTHPNLVGQHLQILPEPVYVAAGPCPRSLPGKFTDPSVGASLNYYSYKLSPRSGE